MTTQTLERTFGLGAEIFERAVRLDYDNTRARLVKKPESPIEDAMLAAMVVMRYFYPSVCFEQQEIRGTWKVVSDILWRVTCQPQMGPYRIDFSVEVLDLRTPISTILVECDGHNFHERTKEQAARDRSRDRELTLDGHKVLRFTGSEIFENAINCALEIMNACVAISSDYLAKQAEAE